MISRYPKSTRQNQYYRGGLNQQTRTFEQALQKSHKPTQQIQQDDSKEEDNANKELDDTKIT